MSRDPDDPRNGLSIERPVMVGAAGHVSSGRRRNARAPFGIADRPLEYVSSVRWSSTGICSWSLISVSTLS